MNTKNLRILIIAFFAILCSSTLLHAQEKKTVTGTVKNEKGEAIVSAAITEKGTKNGTLTNEVGAFSIQVSSDAKLEVSAIGYKIALVSVVGKNIINISLAQGNATQLSDVVVTALGISRDRRALGYTQEQIKGNELSESNAPNVINALSGKMAGVNISSPNGVEGGTTRIVIDGNNQILGNNLPLIIVDGMPIVNEVSSTAGNVTNPQDWGSPINLINPQDIENMSVLKGPAASALYGSRGANGVILITTKKGAKRNGLGVEYNFGYKITNPYRYLKVQNEYGAGGMVSLNAPQYEKDANSNPMLTDGWTQLYVDQTTGTGPYDIDTWNFVSWPGSGLSWGPKMSGTSIKWWDGSTRQDLPQPNNMKALYQDGHQSTHNVAVSGGNDIASFRFSYSRLDNFAILPNSDFNQNTFTLGTSAKMSDKLNIQANVSYFERAYHNAPNLGNDDGASWQKRLLYNVGRNWQEDDVKNYKNADGSYNQLTNIPWTGNNTYQAWEIMMNNSYQYSKKLLGSIQANYKATDFLDIIFRGSIDNNNNESKTINAPTNAAGTSISIGYNNYLYAHGLTTDNAYNMDVIGTFHKENIAHSNISGRLSFGGTAYKRTLYEISGQTPNSVAYANPNLPYFANYSGATQSSQIPSEYWWGKKINSLYAFANLSYKTFLFLDITARNDWTSSLPSNSWSYMYPSVTGSFIFSDVLHLPSFMSYGKLRAGWVDGASDTEPYRVNLTYNVNTFAGQPTASLPYTLPALNYKPATNKTVDLGLTLGFLKNRFNVDLRYYNGRSENQILSSPLPQSSGVSSAIVNTGVLENSGFDFSFRGTIIDNPNFKWNMGLNFSHNSNKLISLSLGLKQVDMDNIWGSNGVGVSAVVGQQFGSIMGYDFVYDAKTHKPLLQDAATLSANGLPTTMVGALYQSTQQYGNQTPIGNTTPKLRGGFTNSFTFKNGISISTLIDYKIGGDIWSGTYATLMQQGIAPETLKERDGGGLAYTTPDGTSTNWGVILPGVYPDGTTNTKVVHYYFKYVPYGVWSSGPDGSNWIHKTGVFDDTWFKLREVSINYAIGNKWVKKTGFLQGASVSLVGRDLFYLYSSLPDRINPEGINGAGNAQGIEFASLPGTRSVSILVHLMF